MTRTYLVVYEKGESNYSGFVPDVSGCVSVGDSIEDMRANLKEALQLFVDYSSEEGLAVPASTTKNILVPVEGESNPYAEYTVEWLTVDIPAAIQNPAELQAA